MVDGIDGSGKRTIVEAMVNHLADQGKQVFDIGEWSKVHHTLPNAKDMADAEVIVGVEPSYAWAGSAIREEMVRNGRGYSSAEIACAFSLDRLTLYRRCYLPLLKRGATIIAERGVASSIVYQPAADQSISTEDILALNGNVLAMKHAPTHLVIASVDPAIAMQRLTGRSEKNDDAVFEKESFLRVLDERYKSDWFKKLFTDRGSQIHYLDTSPSIDVVKNSARSLLSNFQTLTTNF